MELIDVSPRQRRHALVLQRTADALCYTRMIAGPLVGAYIAKERNYRSWRLAGAIGALAITDAIDGKLARKAAAIDPAVRSQRGAWLDQMADKVFTHGLLTGMAINAGRAERTQAAAILANQAIQLGRDVWITNVRKEAAEHNVKTNAQTLGKIKTGVILASEIVMASPLADHEPVDTVAISGMTVGSTLSLVSGISLAASLRAGIEAAEQLEIEKEPALLPTLAIET